MSLVKAGLMGIWDVEMFFFSESRGVPFFWGIRLRGILFYLGCRRGTLLIRSAVDRNSMSNAMCSAQSHEGI